MSENADSQPNDPAPHDAPHADLHAPGGVEHRSETDAVSMVESPPTSIGGILRRLGPGLIVAGSIVGSGELIATTSVGAQAGFTLLWIIIIGCLIKVFVQIELGRYTITTGNTTMTGMNEVPGPVVEISPQRRGSWLVWYWLIMFLASIGQLGGIVGGVGQALMISAPLTEAGREYNTFVSDQIRLHVAEKELALAKKRVDAGDEAAAASVARLTTEIQKLAPVVAQRENKLIAALGAAELKRLGIETPQQVAESRLVGALGQFEYEQLGGDSSKKDLKPLLDNLGPWLFQNVGGDPGDIGTDAASRAARYAAFIEQLGRRRLSALTNDGADPREAATQWLGSQKFESQGRKPDRSKVQDDRYWAAIITVVTAFVLVWGRYGLIQTFATVMVALFTLLTVVNLFMLQSHGAWAVSGAELAQGMSFQFGDTRGLFTALAAFGIIGVGASELVTYPYWCQEKGYARLTGPRDDTPAWAERARGWMRVMRWDAWCSMVVYTFATIAFFLLGAAVLNRVSLDPEGMDMIRTLGLMYAPVFGQGAEALFLFGAFAVLYSTFFVANASHARVFPDALRVLGFGGDSPEARLRRVRFFSGLFPFLCLAFYWWIRLPRELVLFSGIVQALMLPMLAGAALYFRYRRSDTRLLPGKIWDAFLWISSLGLLVAGVTALLKATGLMA